MSLRKYSYMIFTIARQHKKVWRVLSLAGALLLLSACSNIHDPDQVHVERVLPEKDNGANLSFSSDSTATVANGPTILAEGQSIPPPQTACSECYYAQAGDTVYSVAVRFKKDYRDIAFWNHIAPDQPIVAGRLLFLSQQAEQSHHLPAQGQSSGNIAVGHVESQSSATDDDLYTRSWVRRPDSAAPKTVVSASHLSLSSPSSESSVQTTSMSPPAVETPTSSMAPEHQSVLNHSDALVKTPSTSAVISKDHNHSSSQPVVMDASRFQWPAVGEVVHLYGQGPEKEGVDIGTTPGSPIYSSASGRVVFAKKDIARYGNLIIIKHDNDWVTAYSHLGDLMVKEGMHVDLGQKIALAPKEKQTDIYIHFEIRHHGHPLDPVSIIMEGGSS